MEKGETFILRNYRSAWQITNSAWQNIMIESDFHYNVISGNDVINIKPIVEGNGNAKNNWLDIEAKNEGTAIVEISYDAINITGPSGAYTGTYASTDPSRKGLFVIKVGVNGTANIDFGLTRTFDTSSFDKNGEDRSSKWDAEFDTVYFDSEFGEITFTPISSEEITSVEILNNPSENENWIQLLADNGVYTANIFEGNNIIKIISGDRVEYQLIRGAKVEIMIENETNPGDIIAPGDTLKVSFNGLYMPMPKFSGIYNPAFGTPNHRISYDGIPEGITLISTVSGNQYNLRAKNDFSISPEGSGEYKINTGYIYYTMMGSDNPTGGHRLLTDQGVGANFSASQTYHVRSVLPDIEIIVTSQGELDKTALDVAVGEAETKAEADYTAESYAVLTDALELPETTQDEVNAKVSAINQAIEGLAEEPVTVGDNEGLSELLLYTGYSQSSMQSTAYLGNKNSEYPERLIFDQKITEYNLYELDSRLNESVRIAVIPSETGSTITVFYGEGLSESKVLNENTSITQHIGTNWVKSINKPGKNTFTIVVTPPEGFENNQVSYIFNMYLKPTLSGLFVEDNGSEVYLDKVFDSTNYVYSSTISNSTNVLEINATPKDENYAISYNDSDNSNVDISETNEIKIEVSFGEGEEKLSNVYTLSINKVSAYDAEFVVEPKDATVVLYDQKGTRLNAVSGSSFEGLLPSLEYTYVVTRCGYIAQKGILTDADSFHHGSLNHNFN